MDRAGPFRPVRRAPFLDARSARYWAHKAGCAYREPVEMASRPLPGSLAHGEFIHAAIDGRSIVRGAHRHHHTVGQPVMRVVDRAHRVRDRMHRATRPFWNAARPSTPRRHPRARLDVAAIGDGARRNALISFMPSTEIRPPSGGNRRAIGLHAMGERVHAGPGVSFGGRPTVSSGSRSRRGQHQRMER